MLHIEWYYLSVLMESAAEILFSVIGTIMQRNSAFRQVL